MPYTSLRGSLLGRTFYIRPMVGWVRYRFEAMEVGGQNMVVFVERSTILQQLNRRGPLDIQKQRTGDYCGGEHLVAETKV